MNFKPILDDRGPRIVKTGAAVGPGVFGNIKAARMALRKWVDVQIAGLRFSRDAALKTRESDLPIDDGQPQSERGIDIPPAPSEADPLAEARIQDAVGRDDLTDIGFLRRT